VSESDLNQYDRFLIEQLVRPIAEALVPQFNEPLRRVTTRC